MDAPAHKLSLGLPPTYKGRHRSTHLGLIELQPEGRRSRLARARPAQRLNSLRSSYCTYCRGEMVRLADSELGTGATYRGVQGSRLSNT